MLMTHCPPDVLWCEHRLLQRHLHALKTLLLAGQWRWPGPAQACLRRRLQALWAHQHGLHRQRIETRLRKRHPGVCAATAVCGCALHAVPLRPTAPLREALALLETLRQGEYSAAAAVVRCVLGLVRSMEAQLKAEAQGWQARAATAAHAAPELNPVPATRTQHPRPGHLPAPVLGQRATRFRRPAAP